MSHPDKALATLHEIAKEFKTFCDGRGRVSEADTRAKVIDRILVDVLGWPEELIERESHTSGPKNGFIDYLIGTPQKPILVVEAKREDVYFNLPEEAGTRRLSLSGTLVTNKEVKETIEQVRQYCVDEALIRYAVATNGYAWIVFEAAPASTGKKWRTGKAVVFYSIEDIAKNFTEFWRLLSHTAVKEGSLVKTFDSTLREPRKQYRVLDDLPNKDMPLGRNKLHAQLSPVIEAFLGDIADQAKTEILESCYVHSLSVRSASSGLKQVIDDSLPRLLREQGTARIKTDKDSSGQFDKEIETAIRVPNWHLYVLLGSIGAGKSTFIKRYIKITGAEALDAHAVYFYVNLLGTPLDPAELEKNWYEQFLSSLRGRYGALITENRKTFKDIYKKELDLLYEARYKAEALSQEELERKYSEEIERRRQDVCDYTCRLLDLAKSRQRAVVVFIDNVDQLSPGYQAQVFLLAQKITRDLGAITILSLREESYYVANTQKTLTAYTNKKFLIASPQFRDLIHKRLQFAMEVLVKSDAELELILRSGMKLDKKVILEFLKILEHSVFVKSQNIARFIEAICGGNMRLALDMFNTFLVSGTTDVDKMLSIYRRDGVYHVAFHEYVKSIMLMDRNYYKESDANPIMNIFECGTEKNSSHFTGLRIVRLLDQHKSEYSPEGRGFVAVQSMFNEFEAAFDNVDDVIRTANRMVRWKLIEVNNKSTESILGASHVRVTSSGLFYLETLAKNFAYLDLVLQDTPVDDLIMHSRLVELVKQVDNLGGRESEKEARLLVRFDRVETFIEYLRKEEEIELESLKFTAAGPIFRAPLIGAIEKDFAAQREWINGRLKANRGRVESEGERAEIPETFQTASFDAPESPPPKVTP